MIISRFLTLLPCLLLLMSCTVSKNQSSTIQPIDEVVSDVLKSIGARGASIAIRRSDTEIYTATYGFGYSLSEPASLGSMSKPVTAYMLLQMATEGLIDLYVPIENYLPELNQLRNGDRVASKTVFDFMTHNSGLPYAQVNLKGDWRDNLTIALTQSPAEGRAYSNENYLILTRVIVSLLGSYEEALNRYINVNGISTFKTSSRYVAPSYAGAGGLEATAADYLLFMEKSAPLSVLQSEDFGISWFHGESGYLYHQGMLSGPGRDQYSLALYGARSSSGELISVVFQTNAFDYDALLIEKLLSTF